MRRRAVNQDVRTTTRSLGGLLAVLPVLAGCVLGDEGEPAAGTVTAAAMESTAPSAPANPWDLPLEARPPLFDPCTEIPESVLNEVGFTAADLEEGMTVHRPGDLLGCNWTGDEVMLDVFTKWVNPRDLSAIQQVNIDGEFKFQERVGLKFHPIDDENDAGVVFFTERGAVFVMVRLATVLGGYRGNPDAKPNEILEGITKSLIGTFPGGDYL